METRENETVQAARAVLSAACEAAFSIRDNAWRFADDDYNEACRFLLTLPLPEREVSRAAYRAAYRAAVESAHADYKATCAAHLAAYRAVVQVVVE